ncbi:unnamed protein product [Auanema sp. JU1783]|nr:unnamed protein product [Auanema sp. JU1783]
MKLLLLFLFVYSCRACDVKFPNNTETTFHWWQCNSGPIQFFNATPYDSTGKNYEYPIHLGKPIVVKTDMFAPHEYNTPSLRKTVTLWSWGGTNGCAWSTLPTFGLLKNIDACQDGIPCPVKPGRQNLNVVIDFTKYETIINMLKDNAPYQLEYFLHDDKTKDEGCVLVQARARIP